VLLELSDLELECGLGITHPMHRKKLRLAIEEHRQPALVRYPCIAQLGHTWVASEWLPDLGLSQVSDSFPGIRGGSRSSFKRMAGWAARGGPIERVDLVKAVVPWSEHKMI
jgi:hypothetical protein